MAEINARALMFNLGREDAIDSTTSAKIARYAERKQLAYKLTDEGVLLLDGRGKKIHLRNGVVTLRNALCLHALPERIGDNRVLNKQQQHTNVVTMLHVRKMALVDPRLLKSLRENPTPLPDAIDTALRDLDAEMTSILDGSDADESEKVRLYEERGGRDDDADDGVGGRTGGHRGNASQNATNEGTSVAVGSNVERKRRVDPQRCGDTWQ